MNYKLRINIMRDKEDNIIVAKSFSFAVRCVNLNKHLANTKSEYILSKQLLRSGTSIGANVKEALRAQSEADFVSKLNISLKEASETEYWLDLLYSTDYLSECEYSSMIADNHELLKLLTSIIKSTKSKINSPNNKIRNS